MRRVAAIVAAVVAVNVGVASVGWQAHRDAEAARRAATMAARQHSDAALRAYADEQLRVVRAEQRRSCHQRAATRVEGRRRARLEERLQVALHDFAVSAARARAATGDRVVAREYAAVARRVTALQPRSLPPIRCDRLPG